MQNINTFIDIQDSDEESEDGDISVDGEEYETNEISENEKEDSSRRNKRETTDPVTEWTIKSKTHAAPSVTMEQYEGIIQDDSSQPH